MIEEEYAFEKQAVATQMGVPAPMSYPSLAWLGETEKPITNVNAGGCAPDLAALTRRRFQAGPCGFEAWDERTSFWPGRAHLATVLPLVRKWVVVRDGQNTN
jgi:hypothetical protein